MITGEVSQKGEAQVLLRVRSRPGGNVVVVRALIDTGYNGKLALSSADSAGLGLSHWQAIQYTLADGSQATSEVFLGEIEWHGVWRPLSVIEANGGNLLGMGMLTGCHVGIDVVDGGKVEILKLATP